MLLLALLPACKPDKSGLYLAPQRLALAQIADEDNSDTVPAPAGSTPFSSGKQMSFPADDSCRAMMGTTTVRTDSLEFRALRPGSGFVIETDLAASDYNQFSIAIRTNVGAECRLAWSSDIEPVDPADWNYSKAPFVTTKLFPNSEFQTYTFDLGELGAPEWAGRINSLFVSPIESNGTAFVKDMQLSRVPLDAPRQITLGEVTLDALEGSQNPWTVTVPSDGIFETYIGMLPRAWTGNFMGSSRFLVTLDSRNESGVVIADKTLRPGHIGAHRKWVPLRADLSEYADQEISLHLTVDNLGLPLADYAFWGAPMVFSQAPDPESIPVILISCDTLRADHLSCYGYALKTTPRLDQFAAEDAVLFENAIVPITWTLPSHMTMFTGLYPANHRTTETSNLPRSIPTLPEILQENGYLTSVFTGCNWWFLPDRGFARGIDYYDIPDRTDNFRHIYATGSLVDDWISAHAVPRSFLFFHNYDIHGKGSNGPFVLPYDPQDPEFRVFSSGIYQNGLFDPQRLQGLYGSNVLHAHQSGSLTLDETQLKVLPLLYDDSIRMVDESIHDLFVKLKEKNLYDNALIIVTADHGETLMERGYFGHYSVYEEVCRVPLLVKFPGGEFGGRRFTPQVETTDIFATVLDVLGLPPVPSDGNSLKKMVAGTQPPRDYTYSQREVERMVRTPEWKLFWDRETAGDYRLYNLTTDPGEKSNVYADQLAAADPLRAKLHEFYANSAEGWHLRLETPLASWPGKVLLEAEGIQAFSRKASGATLTHEPAPGENRLILDAASVDLHDLVFRAAGTGGRIKIELTGHERFTVEAAGETSAPAGTYTALLDAEARAYAQPGENPGTELTRFSIWYVPPGEAQEAAQAPDAAMIQTLQGIGYL